MRRLDVVGCAWFAAVLAGTPAAAQESEPTTRPTRSAPPFGAIPADGASPAARFDRAVRAGDDATARAALSEALLPREGRAAALGTTLASAEATGRVALWLEEAAAASDADPGDPAAAYFVGFVLQGTKLLARADAYLGRAATADPGAPSIRSAYAWNAFYRFDVPSALARAQGGDFPGRDALLLAKAAAESSGSAGGAALWTTYAAAAAAFLWAARRILGRA